LTHADSGSQSGASFTFATLGLAVSDAEDLSVFVDGVEQSV